MDASVYKRPDRTRKIHVTPIKDRRPLVQKLEIVINKPLVVHHSTECHVTPIEVSLRMAEYISLPYDGSLLEPQGGTGNLVQAAIDCGWTDITVVEREYSLAKYMSSRFENRDLRLVNSCFLDYAATQHNFKYDAILSNPPFKKVYAHIKAEISLLKPKGVIVALVPLSFCMDGFIEMESLGSDSFCNAKVLTKIVRYEHH